MRPLIIPLSLTLHLLCSSAGLQAARNDVTLVMTQEPDSLDPKFGSMVAGTLIRGATLHELTVRDENWELIPQLAEEVPTLENGGIQIDDEGRQTTTFRIRKDAKWSDGHDLTAEDFIFTWKVAMDPRQRVISRESEVLVERLEAPDPKTLVVHWKKPYAYSNNYRVLRCTPAHYLREVYEQNPEGYYKSRRVNQSPLASGPFQLQEWVPGERLVLVPNPHYYGEKPKLEKITYRIVGNTNTAIAQLRAGATDLLSTLSISLDQALSLKKNYKDRFQVNLVPGLVWEHLDLKLEDPIMRDLRVRQAILHGIDRDIISRVLFEGHQPVSDSFLPPKHYAYRPVLSGVRRDVEKARSLLEEAGWKPGPGGIRVNDAGERLELVIETTAGDGLREQVQQLFQDQLREVGIDLEIQNLPAKVFFSVRTRHRTYHHIAMFAWTMSPVADGITTLSDDMIPSEENSWVGQNISGWKNAEVTEIIKQVQSTLDEDGRALLLGKVQEIWADELPSIPLFNRVSVSVQDPRFEGFKPTGSLVPETWNCQEWHWAEE